MKKKKSKLKENKSTLKEDKSKLKIANVVILIIFIIAIAVCVKFLFFNKKETEEPLQIISYGNYSFVRLNSSWIFDFKGKANTYQIPIYFIPGELDYISNGNVTQLDILERKMFYLTLDNGLTSKSVLAGVEIGKVFGQGGVMKRTLKSGVTYEDARVPLITCQNVTNETGVILMTLSNTTQIRKENDCIILSAAKEDDMMKLADRLIYIALGVMK